MRRDAVGHYQSLGQPESVGSGAGEADVTRVRRIEGSPENAYSYFYLPLLYVDFFAHDFRRRNKQAYRAENVEHGPRDAEA